MASGVMHLTPSQVDAFARLAEARFVDELRGHLHTRFPARFVGRDDAAVRAVAGRVVQIGVAHGLTRRVDLRTLAECLLSLDQAAAAETVLRRADLSGPEKAALLHDHLVFGINGRSDPSDPPGPRAAR